LLLLLLLLLCVCALLFNYCSGVSNRQNVKNALVAVCLAGMPNDQRRKEAITGEERVLLIIDEKLD
jgi:hypothetical protein